MKIFNIIWIWINIKCHQFQKEFFLIMKLNYYIVFGKRCVIEEWFEKMWTINWKSYLEYYEESMTIHAPYSNNGVCQMYEVADWQVFKL